LDEYKEKEARRLFEEQQTEQLVSNEPVTGTADKTETGSAEHVLSDGLPVEAADNKEANATEQVASNKLPVEATDKMEPGATEQVASNKLPVEATDKMEPGITRQMPSNVSVAGVKEKTASSRIEEIPTDMLKTETGDKAEDGAKSAMKINRNLVFLLISVLAIGIVILGVFLSLKSNDLGELSAQLNKSAQGLAELQTQLDGYQQDMEELTAQVTQAQQQIETLQAEINVSKPLTPGEHLVYSGAVSAGELVSIPVEMKQFEEVQGKITGGISGLALFIQDSGGSIVKNFGIILSSSFTFKAQTSGSYNIVIQGTGELPTKYNLEYTIYIRQ
jgi:cell division protein FtsB